MTHLFQAGLLAAVVLLWHVLRPTIDPFRIQARTASQLSSHQWSREWLRHGIEARERNRRWKRERRDWLKALSRHLAACEARWQHEGWTGVPRVVTFHRRYSEEQQR